MKNEILYKECLRIIEKIDELESYIFSKVNENLKGIDWVQEVRNVCIECLINAEDIAHKFQIENKSVRGLVAEIMLNELAVFYFSKFPKNDLLFRSSLIIPGERNKTTELDLVILTKIGVFVIESKSIFGKISTKSNKLVGVYSQNNESRETKINAFNQNEMHARALKRYFNHINIPIKDLIYIFSIGELSKDIEEKKTILTTDNFFKAMDKVLNEMLSNKNWISDEDFKIAYNLLIGETQIEEKANHLYNLKMEILKERS